VIISLGHRLRLVAFGVLVGTAYGLLIRLGSQIQALENIVPVMSLSFLPILPFAMGYLTVFFVEHSQELPIWVWVLLPWLPIVAATASTILFYWEGFICAVFFISIALVLSSLGGLLGGYITRGRRSRVTKNTLLTCVMLLPIAIGPWETSLFVNQEIRVVETIIDIHAPVAGVWKNIERVPAIGKNELQPSWSQKVGFPSPVEATLSYEGIGGIRHASFAGGVLFIVTVDGWEPEHRLAFSIHAEANTIPNTTLDEHVRVGGQFFDVLRGQYVLEPLGNGITRLHLSSQHRIATDFNWYAHLWTDAIMADLQQTILHVVQRRCESETVRKYP
jgi:hypothetical protein